MINVKFNFFTMSIPSATISSKKQITIPAEVSRKLNLKPKMKVLFLEMRPGEFQLVAAGDDSSHKDWPKGLCGKYRDDSIDGVQSVLDYKKEDMELEERGYL